MSEPHPLVRKFETLVRLSDSDRQILSELPLQLADVSADQDLVRQGDRPSRCCLILDGFTANAKTTKTGRRQIVAFHFPGDIPDLQSFQLRILDSSILTVTRCQIGFVRHEDLRRAMRASRVIQHAFWRMALTDLSTVREWVANIGQREAYPRVAHLMCEVLTRLDAIGRADGHACAFPYTQAELGEATGMTSVHVNRTIQALRTSNLISLASSRLEVRDWDRLKAVAGFDPTYLHLRQVEHWAE